jgi:hypothetical protein
MIIVYTIGDTKSYDQALSSVSNPQYVYKLGAYAEEYGSYEGGCIWKTPQEAEAFIHSPTFLQIDWGDGKSRDPKDFSVYQVGLVNDWSDISANTGENGYYYLLVDSRLSKWRQ